jgi:UDP-glucose:(heptosyl)LPS alpha-1,3-glucosyltransferase
MAVEIALLAEALDPARGGGAEVAVRAIARAIARAGAEVAVYAPADRIGPEERGVKVIGVPVRATSGPARVIEVSRSLAPAARAGGARVLIACGKIRDAHLVWVHGGVHAAARAASAAAGRSALGAALARAGRFLRPTEHAIDDVERELYAACRRGEARAVALSLRVRRDLEPFLGEAARAVPIVRNGVDVGAFERPPLNSARPELRRELEVGSGDAIGLFVAHRFALKGLDALLRALPLAPRLRLAVAGRDDRAPFERLARRHGVAGRVRFLGARDDLARLYEACDVFVHPSRYDPCSLVVLEALAAGKPVVASRLDGASEVVEDGDAGFVVDDPDDEIVLGERLRRLSDDEALRARLAERARKAARSVDQAARELIDLARGVAK